MENKIVFISHIEEEKDLARWMKELIEPPFLGLVEVFVSSDERSLTLGDKWLDEITGSLKECICLVILLSPNSIGRPWINFEAGTGWVRDIPVIPICHSGLKPAELPLPLKLLTGTSLTDEDAGMRIFSKIASAADMKTPQLPPGIREAAVRLEKRFSFWDKCNRALKLLFGSNPAILPALKHGQPFRLRGLQGDLNSLQRDTIFLVQEGLLGIDWTGGIAQGPGGFYVYLMISPTAKSPSFFEDPDCAFAEQWARA